MPTGTKQAGSSRRACLLVSILLGLGTCCSMQAREVDVEILHTADLNGCLLEEDHGLLACAAYIRDRQHHNPDALLVDCGDAVGLSVESCWKRGQLFQDAMEALEYDVRVPGDVEWRNGVVNPGSMICANISGPAVAEWSPVLMKEVEGVKIVFIGLTMPAVPLYMLPAERRGIEFVPSLEALRAVMPRVRQMNPDILVLAAHQGCLLFDDNENQLNAVIKHFPEIDVVLGGQTKQPVHGRRVGNALYAQAGAEGRGIGRVDLRFDTVTRQVQSRGIFVPVNKSLTPHDLGRKFEDDFKSAQRYASVPIGTVPQETTWEGLLADALRETYNADAALLPVMDEAVPADRKLTVEDICRHVPDWRLAVLSLTAGELEDVMEEGWTDRNRTLSLAGLRCRVNRKGSMGHRIQAVLTPEGEAPHPRKQFRVVCPAMLLASDGGRLQQLRKLAQTPTTAMLLQERSAHDVLSAYVRKHYAR